MPGGPYLVADHIRRGGSPLRARPADFEDVFVRIGRLQCEEHYQVHKRSINRWLDECGRWELIATRRAFVRREMAEARLGKAMAAKVQALEAETAARLHLVSPRLAGMAADYLRTSDGGGWYVRQTSDGEWVVVRRTLCAEELLAKAKRHGFDHKAAALRTGDGFGVGFGR